MESGGVKLQTMLDDINRLKAEKCRLENTLKVVRLERMRKQEIGACLSQKRTEITYKLKAKEERLNVLKHQVEQQQAEITSLQRDVATKAENVKLVNDEVCVLNRPSVFIRCSNIY